MTVYEDERWSAFTYQWRQIGELWRDRLCLLGWRPRKFA